MPETEGLAGSPPRPRHVAAAVVALHAEDALAETFRTAFEKLDTFTDRGVSVYFWFARIAANKALDMHRAKGTTGRALANFESLVAPLSEGTPDPSELFDLRADFVTVRETVAGVLAELNERYRRAIELRFVEEPLRSRFEPALLWALAQSVGFYPPGQLVELDDGRIAVVLAPNPADLERPSVRVVARATPSGVGWQA